MNSNLLIIDDDHELCDLLRDYLEPEGFSITTCHNGEDGAAEALKSDYALVVLDVMLPQLNGFDVLRRIRELSRVPVLMLTARGDDIDRIVGLELGADDYLGKPFNPRELLARIRAIQRRSESPSAKITTETYSIDDVQLDSATRSVTCGKERLTLTAVEFDLLAELLRLVGTVVHREELTKRVLGRELNPFDRSIDVHVSSLRRKLGHRSDGGDRIQAIRGVGYQYTRTPLLTDDEKG